MGSGENRLKNRDCKEKIFLSQGRAISNNSAENLGSPYAAIPITLYSSNLLYPRNLIRSEYKLPNELLIPFSRIIFNPFESAVPIMPDKASANKKKKMMIIIGASVLVVVIAVGTVVGLALAGKINIPGLTPKKKAIVKSAPNG